MQTDRTEIIRAYELKKGDTFLLYGAKRTVSEINKGRITYITNLEGGEKNKASIGQFSQQRIERICKSATNFNTHKNK